MSRSKTVEMSKNDDLIELQNEFNELKEEKIKSLNKEQERNQKLKPDNNFYLMRGQDPFLNERAIGERVGRGYARYKEQSRHIKSQDEIRKTIK